MRGSDEYFTKWRYLASNPARRLRLFRCLCPMNRAKKPVATQYPHAVQRSFKVCATRAQQHNNSKKSPLNAYTLTADSMYERETFSMKRCSHRWQPMCTRHRRITFLTKISGTCLSSWLSRVNAQHLFVYYSTKSLSGQPVSAVVGTSP